jgi:hypothetical protein
VESQSGSLVNRSMPTTQTTPTLDTKQKRFKGSLTGTLVRTLLIFTFIPLALMAGAAYFRARTLLREQAVNQSQNLLTNQLEIIDREINNKESLLERQVTGDDFKILTELLYSISFFWLMQMGTSRFQAILNGRGR